MTSETPETLELLEALKTSFGTKATVTVPLALLKFIDRVFLPKNPREMRGAHPSVPAAVEEFRRLLNAARTE